MGAAARGGLILVLLLVAMFECAHGEAMELAREQQSKVDQLTEEMMQKMTEMETSFNQQKLPLYTERNAILRTVKGFWMRVITNHPGHTAWLVPQDREVLKYLTDVTVEDADPTRMHYNQYKISLTFEQNPYFTDTVLSRDINGVADDSNAKVSGVNWMPGKRPQGPSFFNFFEISASQPGFMDGHTLNDVAHVFRYEFWPNPFTYHDLPSYEDYTAPPPPSEEPDHTHENPEPVQELPHDEN